MEEKKAIALLKQVCKVLDNQGIEYWLDMGSLLGAVRDGKIIEWDSDIDLSLWYKDYTRAALSCKELINNGFKVFFQTRSEIAIIKDHCRLTINFYTLLDINAIKDFARQKNHLGYLIRLMIHYLNLFLITSDFSKINLKSKILTKILKISINIPYEMKVYLINNVLKEIIFFIDEKIASHYIFSIVPKHYFTNLSTIKFYGIKFKIPAETEKYLAYRYGEDWRIPKRDYFFREDDRTII